MPPSLPFTKLDETNYDDWKLQMEAHLIEKGLFGVIDGTEELSTSGPNSKAMHSYRQKQNLTCSKLILGIEASQLPHVHEKDPAEIWRKLNQIHSARGLGTLLTMRHNFCTMTMPPDSTITSWVAKVRHAAYQLDECYRLEEESDEPAEPAASLPHRVTELDKVMILASGLPNTYSSLMVYISTILSNKLDFKDVVTALLNEEQRQGPNITSLSQSLLKTTISTLSDNVASAAISSQKPGARTGFCPSKKPGVTSINCHKCGGVGHYQHQCPSCNMDIPTCQACGNPQANSITEHENSSTSANTVLD